MVEEEGRAHVRLTGTVLEVTPRVRSMASASAMATSLGGATAGAVEGELEVEGEVVGGVVEEGLKEEGRAPAHLTPTAPPPIRSVRSMVSASARSTRWAGTDPSHPPTPD